MFQAPDHFYRQSAVIPYRVRNGVPEVLLITSRKRKRWVIPKGVIEPGLNPAESAAQEAWEEAGLMGVVSEEPVGAYRYQKWGGVCHVEVFLMLVKEILDRWPEDFRERQWLGLTDAARRVDEEKLKQLIRTLPEFLA